MLREAVDINVLKEKKYAPIHTWQIEDILNSIENKNGIRIFFDYGKEVVTFQFFDRYKGISVVTGVMNRPMTPTEIQSLDNDGEVHIKEYQYSQSDCYEIFKSNADSMWAVKCKDNVISAGIDLIDEASRRVTAAILSKDNIDTTMLVEDDEDDTDEHEE